MNACMRWPIFDSFAKSVKKSLRDDKRYDFYEMRPDDYNLNVIMMNQAHGNRALIVVQSKLGSVLGAVPYSGSSADICL